MRKLLSLSIFTAYSVVGMAQLPVSTSSENKNVVLEEFTGIHCVYCPDGHLKAQQFHDANPGDVVLINIHTGGYATPGAGEPDFRTPYGTAIAGQSGLTGYPAGTINRRVFSGMQQGSGTAMSRGSWATAGGTVLSESSYANIAVEGDIDYSTNTLTVTVETYFTGTAPVSNAMLNVAVLQSNILGPQTGGSTYNPGQMTPDGKYIHNHMLRELLTGQWGASIPTTQGVVNTYTYTWAIPANINGVPVSLGDLEVAAFIAEGQQTIVTGANGPITFTLPAGVSSADLEAVNSMTNNGGYCQTTITPEFTIQNNETFAVDSAEAILTFNGGAPISQWVTNIPASGTKVVTFPAQTLANGANTMAFSVSVTGVYKYIDLSASNNITGADDVYKISSTVNNAPVFEDFESTPNQSAPSNLLVEDKSGNVWVIDQNLVNGLSTPLGGYMQSEKSMFWDFYAIQAGIVSSIITEKVDLTNGNGSTFKFDYAYAGYPGATGEKVAIYYSTDCGTTWNKVWEKASGSGLETSAASQSRFFPKSVSDWASVYADISAADGSPEVMIKIEGTSAYGNSLYLDNFTISGQPVGLNENKAEVATNVYPNPASDKFFVELGEPTNFSIQLTTTTGQVVRVAEFVKTAKAEINTANLSKGVYILNVISENGTSSQRVTIAD